MGEKMICVYHQDDKAKTSVKSHYLPIRMAKLQDTQPPSAACGAAGSLSHCCGNSKQYSHFGRQFGNFLQIYNMLIGSSNQTLVQSCSIHTKQLKTCLHKNLYNDVYSDSSNSLIITETWKQLRWPPLNKWLYTVKLFIYLFRYCKKVFSAENKIGYQGMKRHGGF